MMKTKMQKEKNAKKISKPTQRFDVVLHLYYIEKKGF